MSRRGTVLFFLAMVYGGMAGLIAAFVAGLIANQVASPFVAGSSLLEAMTVFVIVVAAVGGVAMLPLGKLMRVFAACWDARFDEEGRSWAVVEAERVIERAGEQR